VIKKLLINIGPILSGYYGMYVFEFLQMLSSEPCLRRIERQYILHNLEQLAGDVNTFQASLHFHVRYSCLNGKVHLCQSMKSPKTCCKHRSA